MGLDHMGHAVLLVLVLLLLGFDSIGLYNLVRIDNSIDYQKGLDNRRCSMGLIDMDFVVVEFVVVLVLVVVFVHYNLDL